MTTFGPHQQFPSGKALTSVYPCFLPSPVPILPTSFCVSHAIHSVSLSRTSSVSLEDLDVEEMALVLGGALGCRRARDTRRSVTCEGSLSSLTEEEAGIETQPHLCSPLEVCM